MTRTHWPTGSAGCWEAASPEPWRFDCLRLRLLVSSLSIMKQIAPDTSILDLDFLGYREAIGPALLEGDSELVMIDCGPSSSLPSLREELAKRGFRVKDLTDLLLTHIHLDHAGATGSLLRENPQLRVYVHEKGAPHMANPEKLLKSAGRLYGDKMQQMYGDFLAS